MPRPLANQALERLLQRHARKLGCDRESLDMRAVAHLAGISQPTWIAHYVQRLRPRPAVEAKLAAFLGLSIPALRHALWPAIYPRPRASARSKPPSAAP